MTTYHKLSYLRQVATIDEPPSQAQADSVRILIQEPLMASYFFSVATSKYWIDDLINGMDKHQTNPEIFRYYYPYIFNLAETDSDRFIEITNQFKHSFDYYGYIQIIKIACGLSSTEAINLYPVIESYLNRSGQKSAGSIVDYIRHISQTNEGLNLSLSIIPALISFRPIKPETHDELHPYFSSQKAAPVIDSSSYKDLLVDAVHPLALTRPRETTRLLIESVDEMLHLVTEPQEAASTVRSDHSEIWCRRLDEVGEYDDAKAALVYTLTFSCENLFRNSTEDALHLDSALRGQPWLVFKRLRQHLYANFITELVKPWIREFILTHTDYSEWDHHYEFQQMVQKACETFGEDLLTKPERKTIFDAILSGPSKDRAREWMGDRFTEEGFKKRQDYFHRKQLRPFASILFGRYKQIYKILISTGEENLTDDDYSPVGRSQSGFVSYRSPLPPDEIEQLRDEDLLNYINTWEASHRDIKDWLIEINISALAGAFETVLRQKIFPDASRAKFWFDNKGLILRPIYVRFLLKALQGEIKDGNFTYLDAALDICQWVLMMPQNSNPNDSTVDGHEESSERPEWSPVRRGVVDFVGACVGKDAKTPITARAVLSELLTALCTQPDLRLDQVKDTTQNQRDYLTDAINNTRGIALENVIDLGFWLLRESPNGPTPEVGTILDHRFAISDSLPVTFPEYALLGRQFGNLVILDDKWATSHKNLIFPKDNNDLWEIAFGTFVRFNNPYKRPFNILYNDYIFALDQLDPTAEDDQGRKGWTQALGNHVFMFYIWGDYSLTGSDSLLNKFYEKTISHPKCWANLFDHVGRLLRNTTENLATALKVRIIAFAEWRLAQQNQEELAAYTFWLEAESLDPEWRLKTFSKILDFAPGRDVATSIKLDAMNELLPSYPDLVAECFYKLTRGLEKNDFIYLQPEKAKPILSSGLKSRNKETIIYAEQARELLLQAGRFTFLEV
ncbi:hypothetical protein [Rariglobus hedericola]|uniref:Uncharacterized protein n=1 Tax=Rariglobus hedericola TaxID=2597822 RepID=A0A556QRI1_9BACT|nr:hypothetical protein [Rariglobus hedericola]TSJ79233.1 hypothetical protein FPL22_08055 [Rariglobus hedericola]